MGVSTDGEISYGIAFEEDFEFPWDDDQGSDLDGWWLKVNGYTPPFEVYTESGEYVGGKRPSEGKLSEYFKHQREFEAAHPIPVELVNVCSGEYPQYILALKGTVLTANRGFPKAFDPASLVITDEQRNMLIDFCKTYHIETDSEPGWYLSSYWG